MLKLIYYSENTESNEYLNKFTLRKVSSIIELIKTITSEEYDAIIVQSAFVDISVKLFVDLVKYLSPGTEIIYVGKIDDELEELLYMLNIEKVIDLNKSDCLNEAKYDKMLSGLRSDKKRYIIDRKNSLEVDVVLKIVNQNSNPVKLSNTEYKLLEYLLKNKGKILSRKKIEQNIWGNNISEFDSRVIDVYILKLRRKFGEGCIKTVRGKGYKWN